MTACQPADGARPHAAYVGAPSGSGNGSGSGSGSGSGGDPAVAAGAGGSDPGGSGGGVPVAGQGGGGIPVGGTGGSGGLGTGGVGGGAGGTTGPDLFGTDPNRNAVMPGTICDRLATIQCAAEQLCCTSPGRDFATCKQAMNTSCTDDAMADTVAQQSRTGFDPTQAKAVFTHLEDLSRACDPGVVAYGASLQGLRTMFKGTIAPGASCRPLNLLDMTMAGAALASCTMSDGYACLPGDIDWLCSAHASAGGHCFTDINCKDGLFCDNPNLSISGSTCMPRKADGASCGQANECSSLICTSGKCVPADQQSTYCLQ